MKKIPKELRFDKEIDTAQKLNAEKVIAEENEPLEEYDLLKNLKEKLLTVDSPLEDIPLYEESEDLPYGFSTKQTGPEYYKYKERKSDDPLFVKNGKILLRMLKRGDTNKVRVKPNNMTSKEVTYQFNVTEDWIVDTIRGKTRKKALQWLKETTGYDYFVMTVNGGVKMGSIESC